MSIENPKNNRDKRKRKRKEKKNKHTENWIMLPPQLQTLLKHGFETLEEVLEKNGKELNSYPALSKLEKIITQNNNKIGQNLLSKCQAEITNLIESGDIEIENSDYEGFNTLFYFNQANKKSQIETVDRKETSDAKVKNILNEIIAELDQTIPSNEIADLKEKTRNELSNLISEVNKNNIESVLKKANKIINTLENRATWQNLQGLDKIKKPIDNLKELLDQTVKERKSALKKGIWSTTLYGLSSVGRWLLNVPWIFEMVTYAAKPYGSVEDFAKSFTKNAKKPKPSDKSKKTSK